MEIPLSVSIWPRAFFQIHAVVAAGAVVVRKAVRRTQVLSFFAKLPPCLVGIEACGSSQHQARK
jgi:transposase